MNGYNRHSQYKRGVYRRRQLRTVWITVGVVLLLTAIVLLIAGTILSRRGRAQGSASVGSEVSSAPAESIKTAPVLKAVPVLLETTGSDTLSTRLREITDGGLSAASVPLNQASGALLYHSDLAVALGFTLGGDFSVTLPHAVETAAERGVYLSGTYFLSALSIEDDLERSVALSRSAAVIAEALRNGLPEVLLVLPSLTAEQQSALLGLMEDVRALTPNGLLGCAIPPALFGEELASERTDQLFRAFDFLALDLTAVGEEDPILYAESTLSASGTLFYLLRYEMRALLPQLSEEATQNQLIATVESGWTGNWQILSGITRNS